MNGRRFVRAWLTALAFGVVGLPDAGLAAQPRTLSVIRSASVMLSDLFTGLLPGQDCDIGPGPAPGGRIIVDQPQLAAIAEQFGVEWQPGPLVVRVVIERKGRRVDREEMLPLIRRALGEAGASADVEITLGSSDSLLVPAEFTGSPEIESMEYDHGSGRFVASLLFDAAGTDPLRVRIPGTAQEMVAIPVLVHAMDAGSILESSDLQSQRVRKGLVGERILLAARDGLGLALRHRTMAGAPLSLDELERPDLVLRGMPVLLRLDSPGLLLTTKGQAIETGALDDRIHILNPESRTVVVARVTGPGTVQVDPASTPVILASQQSGLPSPYSLGGTTASSGQRGSTR